MERTFPVVRHDKYITYHIRENTEIKQYHGSDIKLFISGGDEHETSYSDPSFISSSELFH